jgi:hypothetical protein
MDARTCTPAHKPDEVHAIAHKPAVLDVELEREHGRQPMLDRQLRDSYAVWREHIVPIRTICASACVRARKAEENSYGEFSSLSPRSANPFTAAWRSAASNWSADTASHSTPRRLRSGNASCSTSTCFVVISVQRQSRPVMLPPGRAKLCTNPLATGSILIAAMTIGIGGRAATAALSAYSDSIYENHIRVPGNQLVDCRGGLREALADRAILHHDISALLEAELAQLRWKDWIGVSQGRNGVERWSQYANARDAHLLRVRGDRPCSR